jgi:hypothetical protein
VLAPAAVAAVAAELAEAAVSAAPAKKGSSMGPLLLTAAEASSDATICKGNCRHIGSSLSLRPNPMHTQTAVAVACKLYVAVVLIHNLHLCCASFIIEVPHNLSAFNQMRSSSSSSGMLDHVV